MTAETIPARLAALKNTSIPDLKTQWRDLFDSEPPPFNRRYLESRLAYRIQELAYGGLKPATVQRLEKLGEQLDGGDREKSRLRADYERPDHRHTLNPRMAGDRTGCYGHCRRFRVARTAVQVALRYRTRHYRHAMEWMGFLWAQEPTGEIMTNQPGHKLRCAILHPQVL